MRRIRRSMSQNIIYPQPDLPVRPELLLTSQIWGYEKAKMQSVYRGSVNIYLDSFQIGGLLVLFTDFLLPSLRVAVSFCVPLL